MRFVEQIAVVAVSPDDAQLMEKEFGISDVDIVENGVDHSHFAQVTETRDRFQILFLGALDWRPNQDAVAFLLKDIFPLVRARIPDARLLVVGRNPPNWLLKQISDASGVQLRANVPDVRPFLAKSSLMIVPLRIGGGSRLKILEALASGLPVVSTAVGAEGLSLKSGRHWIEGNTADELVNATVDCLERQQWAQTIADEGRQIVQQRYDWEHLADKLERAWFKCAPKTQDKNRHGLSV